MKTKSVFWFALGGALALAAGYAVLRSRPSARLTATTVTSASTTADPLARGTPEPGARTGEAAAPNRGTGTTDASAHTPAAILARLRALKVAANHPQSARQLILELERLKEAGPAALPAIREFLAGGEDADYDASAKGAIRGGKVPEDFTVPPSLRLGLLEVVKNIGGEAAQQLLAEALKSTGRGVEVAYLAGVLQSLAPDKYRGATLSAARDLLAMPLTAGAASALDKPDREYLYGVLTTLNDTTYLAQAQTQLVQPGGKVDAAALRYLQTMLGEQTVALAVQEWDDPRIPAAQREPLARVALAYVGVNAQAGQLYQTAINDLNLPKDKRRELIEDLNREGFANAKALTAADLPLIQKRLALIDQLAPAATDPVNAAAFKEAQKDLLKMRDNLLHPPPAKK